VEKYLSSNWSWIHVSTHLFCLASIQLFFERGQPCRGLIFPLVRSTEPEVWKDVGYLKNTHPIGPYVTRGTCQMQAEVAPWPSETDKSQLRISVDIHSGVPFLRKTPATSLEIRLLVNFPINSAITAAAVLQSKGN